MAASASGGVANSGKDAKDAAEDWVNTSDPGGESEEEGVATTKVASATDVPAGESSSGVGMYGACEWDGSGSPCTQVAVRACDDDVLAALLTK